MWACFGILLILRVCAKCVYILHITRYSQLLVPAYQDKRVIPQPVAR